MSQTIADCRLPIAKLEIENRESEIVLFTVRTGVARDTVPVHSDTNRSSQSGLQRLEWVCGASDIIRSHSSRRESWKRCLAGAVS